MDSSIKPSASDPSVAGPSAGASQLALRPVDWGGWSRATALLAGVPVAALGTVAWTPSAVWGLPEPDQSRYPELSFTGALVGHSSDVAAQTCPRYENEPDIREGDILALRIERTAGQWPYEQTIPVDFEILTGSTADASDLGTRKTLQKVSLRFRSAEGFKAIQCHHVDIAKDLKLEGEELLSLRLKPKLGSYRVKSGADRRTIKIAEEGAGILVRYGDETLGSVSSQREFTVRMEAGALPASSPNGGRSCSLQIDTSFSRTIDMDWRVRPGKDPKYGAASLADFTLPSRVTFNQGVAEIKVSAKMDGDTVAEDFKLDRVPQRQEYPALLNLCEPSSVSVPSGVLSAAVFGVIAPAAVAPSKPTGLGATASEDQVNLAWTQSDDGTITGWRYRLRIKGASSWGSAVDMDSSSSSTKSHTVNTSSHFDGIVTEFQVQSYNEVGASPWSDAATATVLKFNNDNPILSISKQGVTVKEGETETWTVKLNGALAGTVRLSEAERSHAGAVRLSPETLTFTAANAQTPQTVTVTGVNAGTEVFNGKRTGEVVVNHAFTLAGSSTPTVAQAGSVEVMVVEGETVNTPSAPQRLAARPGNNQVRLEWTAPEDESITGYEVRQRLAGNGGGSWGGWQRITGSGAGTVSHVVGKLSNGQKYLFQVRAMNEAGAGAPSKRKGATPIGALTVAVEDGRIVEGDDGKKEMEFKVSLSGETVHDVKLQATAVAGAGSTATATGAGQDFVPLSQSVIFAAYGRQHGKREDVNDLEQTVRVQVVGDRLAEGDETFQLRLDNLESEDKRVTLAGGGEKTTATGVITNDDAAPVLALLADVTVTAGQEVAITAAATDADGDTISYTWSRKAGETTPALPQGTALNQARLAFTPTAAGVYTMTVTADDGHGNTATEEVTVTVSAPVIPAPAKPTGFKAAGGNRKVSLSWNNPGNANITKWQLQQKTGSNSYGPWVNISGSGAATVSHTVTGLTNGTAYGFKIRAVAGTVEGAASDGVSATPELTTVSVPATLQVTEGTDTNAVVRLTASRAFGEAVTFNVSYGGTATADVDYDDAVGSVTFNATDTSKDITIPFTDDNLDEDSETITVTVTPAAALPGGAQLGNATTVVTIADDDASPVLADMAPVTVAKFETVDITASATDADGDTLSYSWSRADATRSDSNYYCYLYAPDGKGWSFTDLSSSRLTFASAQAGSCNMRVTVDDGHGNTDSKTVVITVGAPVVSAPAKPTGLAASGGNQQVILSWDNPGNANITKYQVQKREGEGNYGSWTDIPGSGAATTSHTVTGLTNGMAYGFKIRAVAGTVEGVASDEVNAAPKGVTRHILSAPSVHVESGVNLDLLSQNVNLDLSSSSLENSWAMAFSIRSTDYFKAYHSSATSDYFSKTGERVSLQIQYKKTGSPASQWIDVDHWAPYPFCGSNFLISPIYPVGGHSVEFGSFGKCKNTAIDTPWSGVVAYRRTRSLPEDRIAIYYGTIVYEAMSHDVAIRIRGVNSFGPGSPSQWVKVNASVISAPAKPTGLAASGGNQQVILSWDNPGNANITKYQVQKREGEGNYGSWTDIPGSGAATTSHTVTGLTNGTAYGFKIRAVAGTVEGVASDEVNATSKGVTAPTLTATTRANSDGATYSVDLTWTVADTDPHAIVENAERITKWAVYYRLKGATEWTGLDIPNSNAATRSYTHTGKKGTEMEYRVRATGTLQNTVISGEASYSNTVTVRLEGETPAQPTGLSARPGNSAVTLSWDDPSDASITGYELSQKTQDGSWELWKPIQGAGAETVSHTISGLSNGTLYTYKIRAFNGAGAAGEASEEVAATPTGDALTISVGDARVVEGDSESSYLRYSWYLGSRGPLYEQHKSGKMMEFTVTLSGSPSDDVMLQARAFDGPGSTAAGARSPQDFNTINEGSEADFLPLRQPVIFEANASGDALTKIVEVPVFSDFWIEKDETFFLRLDNLTTDDNRVTFAGGRDNIQVTGTIVNDDNPEPPSGPGMTITPGITAGRGLPSHGQYYYYSNLHKAMVSDALERIPPSKTFWSMRFSFDANDQPTGLQIQYERSDRPEEGPSEWIDIDGWRFDRGCYKPQLLSWSVTKSGLRVNELWWGGFDRGCDDTIKTPWPGRVVANKLPNPHGSRFRGAQSYLGDILYEAVPYEISIRIRAVNAAGPGEPSRWVTFTGDQRRRATVHHYTKGAQVSVSDAKVAEAPGAQLKFKITLDRSQIERPSGSIDVTYFTRDRTATAGADYTATSGMVTFAPGETEKTVTVAVLDDTHDEASETMELLVVHLGNHNKYLWNLGSLDWYLRNFSEAPLATGTGTITNTDPIPAAWLGRFGRTVADQALDAVSDRIAAERTPGLSGSLAGQELPHMPFGSGSQEGAEMVSDTTGVEAGDALSEAIYHAATASDSMSGQDLLLGTNFSLTRGADATGGNLTFWGRAAYSGFDGKEDTLSLDGEVVTGLLGMDYARQRWLLGLAVSRSGGTGSYSGGDSGATEGKIEASLTSAIPYGSWQASERVKLWGSLGYGRGEVTLKPKDDKEITADLNWTMAAVGARAALLDPDGEGLSLDLLSDALWTRTTSEKAKVGSLAATEADVTRLRLGLEGSWANLLQGGSELTPKFSLGARLDGGDAETGFGMELGGGVVWSSPGAGLSLDLDARTLLFHEADGLRDWGFSAGLVFDPQPESERGLSVTLGQDWGGEATGGIDALFAANPLEQRSGVEGTSRWTLEAAYGLPAFAGRFTGAPYVGLALAAGARDYTVGWRLTPEVTEQDITFQVKATRSESSAARPDHGVELDIRRTW